MIDKSYVIVTALVFSFFAVRTVAESWASVEKARAEAARPCKCAEAKP